MKSFPLNNLCSMTIRNFKLGWVLLNLGNKKNKLIQKLIHVMVSKSEAKVRREIEVALYSYV